MRECAAVGGWPMRESRAGGGVGGWGVSQCWKSKSGNVALRRPARIKGGLFLADLSHFFGKKKKGF